MVRRMRTVTTEYPVYNVWIQRPFEFDGYAFMPSGGMDGYQERLRVLLASPEDSQTIQVTRNAEEGAAATPSYLWDGGTAIDDFMLLFSVGQGRNVHYKEAIWTAREGEQTVATGVTKQYTSRALVRGEQAVSPFEVEPYLQKAVERVRTPGWLDDTAFTSGAFWYIESLSSVNYEVRYLSAWNGLMALVRRFFLKSGEGGGDAASPGEMILAYRDANEYDFILDQHPPLWEELAKDFLVRHPRERFFIPRDAYIQARKLQFVLLLSLLHLVDFGQVARRDHIMRAIRR